MTHGLRMTHKVSACMSFSQVRTGNRLKALQGVSFSLVKFQGFGQVFYLFMPLVVFSASG